MKVLFVDVNCKGSSTGQIVYNLFSECEKNEIEAAVCYGRGAKIKQTNVYKFGLTIETFFHALLTRLTGYTGCFSYLSTKRLIKYIKSFNPDIVHIHELHAYFVNIKQLLLYLKDNSIKTVFTNHCEFLYTGKCGHAGQCNRYQIACGNCPSLKDYPKSLFFDHTRHMLEDKKNIFSNWNNYFLVTPSSWLKNRMSLSFFASKQIKTINNGIDTSFYKIFISNIKEQYNIPKCNKIVLTAAPNIFTDLKGGKVFLSIAEKMIKNNITFIVVGANNNDQYLTPKNVLVMPFLSDKSILLKFFSASDCFVICSKNEVFPTTSLEAQCCGTKVVGFDVGGVKETILDNNGYVVPYGDIDEMVHSIRIILNEEYDKEVVSKRAKNYFSKERMFRDYFYLYRELCD